MRSASGSQSCLPWSMAPCSWPRSIGTHSYSSAMWGLLLTSSHIVMVWTEVQYLTCSLGCKKGSLMILHYNEIWDELSDLASKALFPSLVRNKPRIYPSHPAGQTWRMTLNPRLAQSPTTSTRTKENTKETCWSVAFGPAGPITLLTSASLM
jgi:hypothetical protein